MRPVPQMPLDLADDVRHRERRELSPAFEVEAVNRVDEPDAAGLKEVVVVLAALVAVREALDEGEVELDQPIPRGDIAACVFHCPLRRHASLIPRGPHAVPGVEKARFRRFSWPLREPRGYLIGGFRLAVCLLISHPQAELHVELHVAAVDSACRGSIRRPSRPRCHVPSQAHWPRRFCCVCPGRALQLVDRMWVNRQRRPAAVTSKSAHRAVCSLVARAMPSTAARRAYDSSSALCAMGPTRPARSTASMVR